MNSYSVYLDFVVSGMLVEHRFALGEWTETFLHARCIDTLSILKSNLFLLLFVNFWLILRILRHVLKVILQIFHVFWIGKFPFVDLYMIIAEWVHTFLSLCTGCLGAIRVNCGA